MGNHLDEGHVRPRHRTESLGLHRNGGSRCPASAACRCERTDRLQARSRCYRRSVDPSTAGHRLDGGVGSWREWCRRDDTTRDSAGTRACAAPAVGQPRCARRGGVQPVDWDARDNRWIRVWLSEDTGTRQSPAVVPASDDCHRHQCDHGSPLRARQELVLAGVRGARTRQAGALGRLDLDGDGWGTSGRR